MDLFDQLAGNRTLKEHISPEGVEEKILHEELFLVTQTQGGKLRAYVVIDGKQNSLGVGDSAAEVIPLLADRMTKCGLLLTLLPSGKPKTEKKP